MPQPTTLTCVIPCLNEEANLQVLLPLLTTVLDSLSLEYEVIVVDDGSTDGTSAAMHVLAARHPEIVYIHISRNFGKEAALNAGLEAECEQGVVGLDADLHHALTLTTPLRTRCKTSDKK